LRFQLPTEHVSVYRPVFQLDHVTFLPFLSLFDPIHRQCVVVPAQLATRLAFIVLFQPLRVLFCLVLVELLLFASDLVVVVYLFLELLYLAYLDLVTFGFLKVLPLRQVFIFLAQPPLWLFCPFLIVIYLVLHLTIYLKGPIPHQPVSVFQAQLLPKKIVLLIHLE
jgi:hypothetical protein